MTMFDPTSIMNTSDKHDIQHLLQLVLVKPDNDLYLVLEGELFSDDNNETPWKLAQFASFISTDTTNNSIKGPDGVQPLKVMYACQLHLLNEYMCKCFYNSTAPTIYDSDWFTLTRNNYQR